MNMGNGIYDIILNLYNNQASIAIGYANTIEPYIRIVASMGALIFIFSRLIVQIANNQEIDFLPYLRPFLILLLIPFSAAICTAIDGFGNNVRGAITTQNVNIATYVKENSDLIREKIDAKWEAIGNNPELYASVFGSNKEDDESFIFGSALVDLKLSFYKFSEDFKFQILTVIQNILLVLMYIAECCVLLISIAFRIVLRIGFPITVALCIFPGFTNSLAMWFGKYINFAIMPAVAAMYSSIAFNLCKTYITSYDVNTAVSSMGIETQQPEFLGLAFIGILILSLIGYTQIPSMTAMLLSVGGVGQIVSVATRNIQSTPRTVSAPVTGAASGAIKGAGIGAVTGAGVGNSAGTRTAGAVVGGAVGGGIGAVAGAARGVKRR
jgi:hypothetical protein